MNKYENLNLTKLEGVEWDIIKNKEILAIYNMD